MQKYVLTLHTTGQPVSNKGIADLHGRASGNLSGQEIKLKNDTLHYLKISGKCS